VILKPEWATDAVYVALDSDVLRKKRGWFSKEDLTEVWSEQRFIGKYDELLQLLVKFRLCYRVPLTDLFIVPQLLSVSAPFYKWDYDNNPTILYDYSFMPKGILSELTVMLHNLIEDDRILWR
jgi:internalin A